MKKIVNGIYNGLNLDGEYVAIDMSLIDWHGDVMSDFLLIIGERNGIPFVREIYDFEKEDRSSYRALKGSKNVKGRLEKVEESNVGYGVFVEVSKDEMIKKIEKIMDIENKKMMMLVGNVLSVKMRIESFEEREEKYEELMSSLYNVDKEEIQEFKYDIEYKNGEKIVKRKSFSKLINGDKAFFRRKKKDWSYLDKENDIEMLNVA